MASESIKCAPAGMNIQRAATRRSPEAERFGQCSEAKPLTHREARRPIKVMLCVTL